MNLSSRLFLLAAASFSFSSCVEYPGGQAMVGGPGMTTTHVDASFGTYDRLPDSYLGDAYYYQNRYYYGGNYQRGRYVYQGRTYNDRYYHGGRYYYGGRNEHHGSSPSSRPHYNQPSHNRNGDHRGHDHR